jgi:hypothetical protein
VSICVSGWVASWVGNCEGRKLGGWPWPWDKDPIGCVLREARFMGGLPKGRRGDRIKRRGRDEEERDIPGGDVGGGLFPPP